MLAASPDSASDHALKGMALEWLGKHEEALAAYKSSLRLEGGSWRTWFRRAWIHGKLGQAAEEEESYREALRRNPRYASAWGNLGTLLSDQDKHAEALEAQTRVVRLTADPEMLHELSMGMSDDFEVAVEEGATMVRVGTGLFGPRPRPEA